MNNNIAKVRDKNIISLRNSWFTGKHGKVVLAKNFARHVNIDSYLYIAITSYGVRIQVFMCRVYIRSCNVV